MKITAISRLVCLSLSLLFISACSEQGFFTDYPSQSYSFQSPSQSYMSKIDTAEKSTYEAKSMEDNNKAIISLGSKIGSALTNIEKIERYRKTRIIKVIDENMAKYGLSDRVYIDWTGPIEPLMREVADYADYKFKVLGMSPAIPVIINSAHNNIELGDIIKEAHLQSRERADVVVYPNSKTIEIRYFELG